MYVRHPIFATHATNATRATNAIHATNATKHALCVEAWRPSPDSILTA